MENDFVSQVKSELTEYSKSLAEIGKLRLIGIVSRVLGLFLLILTVVLCAIGLFAFASVAAIKRVCRFGLLHSSSALSFFCLSY